MSLLERFLSSVFWLSFSFSVLLSSLFCNICPLRFFLLLLLQLLSSHFFSDLHRRLGYVGVVNRSQEDIKNDVPIREALKKEEKFFQTHVLYRQIAARCGTAYLSKTLNKILMNHIRDCLPELKVKIGKMMAETQSELSSYGDSALDGQNSQGETFCFYFICRRWASSLEGESGKYSFPKPKSLGR